MTYFIYASLSAVFLALYDLFKKISLKNNKDVKEVLFLFCFVAFLCSLFFAKDAIVDVSFIFFILIKSFTISLSWFFTTKAISKLDMGIVVPFSLLGTVTTTLFAWVFFDEVIGLVQIGGIIIILLGLFLISRLMNNEDGVKNDYKYLLLLILAAVLSSVSAIIDKKLLISISRGAVLFWFFLFLSIIYLIINLVKRNKIYVRDFRSNIWVILVGVSIFLSDLLYYKALLFNVSLSVVSIIRKLSVFIGVVLSSIFLKERDFIKKIIILIFMFVGIGVILFV